MSADDEISQTDHIFEFDFQPGWIDLGLEDVDWIESDAAATVVVWTEFDSAELKVKPRKLIRDVRDGRWN